MQPFCAPYRRGRGPSTALIPIRFCGPQAHDKSLTPVPQYTDVSSIVAHALQWNRKLNQIRAD